MSETIKCVAVVNAKNGKILSSEPSGNGLPLLFKDHSKEVALRHAEEFDNAEVVPATLIVGEEITNKKGEHCVARSKVNKGPRT